MDNCHYCATLWRVICVADAAPALSGYSQRFLDIFFSNLTEL